MALNRHFAAQLGIVREIDTTHRALAKEAAHLVAPEMFGECQFRIRLFDPGLSTALLILAPAL